MGRAFPNKAKQEESNCKDAVSLKDTRTPVHPTSTIINTEYKAIPKPNSEQLFSITLHASQKQFLRDKKDDSDIFKTSNTAFYSTVYTLIRLYL